MSEPSPLRALFYFCLLIALLFAGLWHFRTPPRADRVAGDQPPPLDFPTPAATPAAAAANIPPMPVAVPSKPPARIVVEVPAGSVAAPPPPAQTPPEPTEMATAEFAGRVTDSQKLAVARYPDLADARSEINARFVARYNAWQGEHSARLRDPDWPLRLADECAVASGVPVVSSVRGSSLPAPAEPLARPPATAAPAATANTTAPSPAALRPPALATPPDSGSAPLISLNVSPLNGGGTYNGHWLTFYNGNELQGKMNRALDLDARNLSAHPSQVVLQWIFTAHHHARGSRTIFDMGSKTWEMQPNESTHFGVRSADLSNRTVWYYNSGYGRYEGSEFDGWLVIARYKDKVLKAVGSSGSLESLVDTPEFASLVSAYQSAHPGGGTPSPGTASSR